MIDILLFNLINPITLAFALGLFARLVKSEFQLPKDIYMGISAYLLFAIGLEGGVELGHASFNEILWPATITLLIGCLTPISSYFVLRKAGNFTVADSAGIAAHYGSVSAVTFIAAQSFVIQMRETHPEIPALEGYLPTLLTLLESPGIHIALLIGAIASNKGEGSKGIGKVFHEVLTGRTMVLLVGGLLVGFLIGEEHWQGIAGFYSTKEPIFRGLLCLFLLEMGVLAGSRLGDLKKVGGFLTAFGIIMPIIHGSLTVCLAMAVGMSPGGSTVLAAMAASASYIAAPPAVRLTLPEANPTLYLTASLAITFPFNILAGIPIFFNLALFIAGM